jgi:hypothetical protein
MANVNSFTETVNILINEVNVALEAMTKLSQSITTQNDTVVMSVDQINPITGDASAVVFSLPAYNTVINKVNALAQTMDSFVKGEGVVLLNDGTYRKVTTIPVATSPSQISGVIPPTKFSTRDNWFFEDLLFPKLVVSFDLKNKIDDRSDRVVVKRIIVDNPADEDTEWFLDNVVGTYRNYYDTITYLNTQGRKFWEDDEVLELPLSTQPFTGSFVITDVQTVDGKQWYYLDTLYYGQTTDLVLLKNHQLSIGDLLRYENSIWKIDDIYINENRIHIIPMVGMDHPTIYNSFEIYTQPFSTKLLDIGVGFNECDIIFIKGINDDFNIIGSDWSLGIPFWTNNLTLSNGNLTLEDYYKSYVSDFGMQLEGQAKEKYIPAFFGEIPDAPVLQ